MVIINDCNISINSSLCCKTQYTGITHIEPTTTTTTTKTTMDDGTASVKRKTNKTRTENEQKLCYIGRKSREKSGRHKRNKKAL